jgi:hypothetical protein
MQNKCPLDPLNLHPGPKADISLRRWRVSEHLLRPRSLAAPEVEVPLPPGPHLGASGEQDAHPEIQAHHGA